MVDAALGQVRLSQHLLVVQLLQLAIVEERADVCIVMIRGNGELSGVCVGR